MWTLLAGLIDVVASCGPPDLTTTVHLDAEIEENIMMINWTDQSMKAENEYRRQQLHRLASHRELPTGRRSGAWNRWLPRGLRH